MKAAPCNDNGGARKRGRDLVTPWLVGFALVLIGVCVSPFVP